MSTPTLPEVDAPAPEPQRPPALGPLELARWAWRQLTSMRTALVLLFLLALAAVPGSLLPQRGVNPISVSDWRRANPEWFPLFDRLSLFDVYAAPWFAAVYLLLFVSLAGCVLPRTRTHWRAARARPPGAPRNLARLPAYRRLEVAADPEAGLDRAQALLRARRYRVDRTGSAVSAERGYLRETGNLVFHLSLLLLLAGVALGSVLGFRGSVLVVEGDGFANTLPAYDDFTPGRFYDPADLAPFSLTLDDFTARFAEEGQQRGAAREFTAAVTYRPAPDSAPRAYELKVNHPLQVGGAKVFLTGHGYAPRFTVRDGTGQVVFAGAVPFLPQDGNFSSTGVVKVPDASPQQLGFSGFFLPTTVVDERGPRSVFPDAKNPSVFLRACAGDLGLDAGAPQSVYRLDETNLDCRLDGGAPLAQALAAGDTMTLPRGLGSLTYEGYDRWVTLNVTRDPGAGLALGAAALALAGVLASLFVARRRLWIRVGAGPDGRSVVEVAGLSRTESPGLEEEVAAVAADLGTSLRGQPAVAQEEKA